MEITSRWNKNYKTLPTGVSTGYSVAIVINSVMGIKEYNGISWDTESLDPYSVIPLKHSESIHSKVLSEFKAHELVECINPEVRKGRLYRLTPKGDKLVKNIE